MTNQLKEINFNVTIEELNENELNFVNKLTELFNEGNTIHVDCRRNNLTFDRMFDLILLSSRIAKKDYSSSESYKDENGNLVGRYLWFRLDNSPSKHCNFNIL